MVKNTEISARISQLIESEGLKPHTFAIKLGYKRSQTLYDILSGKVAPSFDFFNRLSNTEYSEIINLDWLIYGKGPMRKTLNVKEPTASMVNDDGFAHYGKKSIHTGIPLVPTGAVAGYMAGDVDPVYEKDLSYYDVPDFHGKADFLIKVEGMSMQPLYMNGDLIACKRISSKSFIQWNRSHVLDTTQGMLLKRVRQGDDDKQLVLVSENQDFQPFSIRKSEIRSMAIVVGLIRSL